MTQFEATPAETIAVAAVIGAVGSLLGSASSVGSTYAKYQQGAAVSDYAAGTGLSGSSWSLFG